MQVKGPSKKAVKIPRTYRFKDSVVVGLERAQTLTGIDKTNIVEQVLELCLEKFVTMTVAEKRREIERAGRLLESGKLFEVSSGPTPEEKAVEDMARLSGKDSQPEPRGQSRRTRSK